MTQSKLNRRNVLAGSAVAAAGVVVPFAARANVGRSDMADALEQFRSLPADRQEGILAELRSTGDGAATPSTKVRILGKQLADALNDYDEGHWYALAYPSRQTHGGFWLVQDAGDIDAELLALDANMERSYARLQAAERNYALADEVHIAASGRDTAQAEATYRRAEKKVSACYDELWKIGQRIFAIRAKTFAGLRVKTRAADRLAMPIVKGDNPALTSIAEDLEMLAGRVTI